MADNWFDVDKDGFGQLMADRPKVAILHDLIQNVLDEDATRCVITLTLPAGRRDDVARLIVEDDVPTGFADLRDAYTLYKPSKKKDDPTKRGRFNEGEKFVLSQCDSAMIATTTGTVYFDADGTRHTDDHKTSVGSRFEALVRLTAEQVEEVVDDAQRLIIPEDFLVTINGIGIQTRYPLKTTEGTLPTVTVNDDGELTRTRRTCQIDIFPQYYGRQAHLYEMGIPIVEIDCPFDINICQKVPLNRDRDNITPAYRRDLLAIVLDETVDLLKDSQIADSWVKDALAAASPETVKTATIKMFGQGWVIGTPADREADKNAITHGKTVVSGRTLTSDAWDAVRRSNAAVSSATNYSLKPNHGNRPAVRAQANQFTANLKRYATKVCKHLLDTDYVEIDIWDDPGEKHAGMYCGGRIVINLAALRREGSFRDIDTFAHRIDDLLIHECAHKFSDDHLCLAYVQACTSLGAKARTLSTRWKAEVR